MNLAAQNPIEDSSKSVKKRLKEHQVRLLEANFEASKKLDSEKKLHLARELGVSPRQIAIWYQNRRARWKNQSLEVDYSALEVRLEAALSEKRRLEKEVGSLRAELKGCQDIIFAFQQAQFQVGVPPASPLLTTFCEEGGGSSTSMNDDAGCSGNWVNGEALQIEELYSSFMMNTKGLNEKDFWL